MIYRVIIHDSETGREKYIENLNKEQAAAEADKQSQDKTKMVYVSYIRANGKNGYLNRSGPTETCPGEPW